MRRPGTGQLIVEAHQLRITLCRHIRYSDLIIGQLCGVIDAAEEERKRSKKLLNSRYETLPLARPHQHSRGL